MAEQWPPITGHIVGLPAGPHRTLRLMTDVDLLLAATIAAVRINRSPILFEPPASLADCVQCQKAYARASKAIEDAGGIAKWMERFLQAEWGSKADGGEVEP